ncbi:DNA repair protein rad14 [Verticillium alfalfae VaMs.102]|uniref:DNA repair protein rad14 n=1 Tax=Verticillium alfalfae (strain VaMs.102 / ATCC MYA-4576 / FGSC 10136) TaxID=526221 RepID=C9SKX2_VERA1|nr:DNA repair protein rad14 [Verticillium alfalfae VaMs.102]EEY19340.1 DNA repair protein rad14 [Verticillium alfalfae VaMs.102]
MERPKTPPRATQSAPVVSPPTPAVTRRIHEHEQARLASGAPGSTRLPPASSPPITSTSNTRKRTHAIYRRHPPPLRSRPDTVRDARQNPSVDAAPKSLRPARNFTKFVDYDMSAMTDTRGGFLSLDDDPSNPALAPRQKPGQPPPPERPQGMTAGEWEAPADAAPRCSAQGGAVRAVALRCSAMRRCARRKSAARPPRPPLLAPHKTECREDYLLTEGELRDADLLPHLNKPNPHKSHWHDMMLFLRCQVEDYAFNTKWGSEEKLDAEFARREDEKRARKEKKFKEKLTDLKRKTRTEAFRRQAAKGAAGGPTKFGDAVSGGKVCMSGAAR